MTFKNRKGPDESQICITSLRPRAENSRLAGPTAEWGFGEGQQAPSHYLLEGLGERCNLP